ncbi:MAG TPA: TAXI family TRAP transporter solute-binding subunit [Woeseiaceae bacterium]|nr:TAXI family TRAP transporter solute-binding subunit [Woeseiaceae bacterium]
MQHVLYSTRFIVALLVVAFLQLSCSGELAGERPYVLATATVGGTYYPVGVALATISKSKLYPEHGISLAAISSAGSLENIKLLRDNQAQFALLQGVFAAWAWNGEGPVREPQTWLRSVSGMWHNVEHFALLSDLARNGTLSDLGLLDGQRFVLGERNSGAEHTGAYILDSLGIDYRRRMNLSYMGYGATADAIQDGNIVGMNIPAGVPVSAITRAWAVLGSRMVVLDVSDDELAQVNARYPLWDYYEIAAGTYPNQRSPIRSVSHPNVLAVREDVPEETVYQITRSMWENLSTLQEIHRSTNEMKLELALKGLGAPLHPGAARFYRERGLTIPPHLSPP